MPSAIEPASRPMSRAGWVFVAAALLISHIYFDNEFRNFPNPNVQSRVYLTLAIVDDGVLSIDGCIGRYGPTMDAAVVNGRHYSDKAPGFSILLVPVAWLIRHAGLPQSDYRTMAILLRVFGLSLPAVAFWWYSRHTWRRFVGDDRLAAALLLAGALGTNFFIYSTQLFSHSPAGMLLFLAHVHIFRNYPVADSPVRASGGGVPAQSDIADSRRHARTTSHLLTGILLALAFTIDYLSAPAIPLIIAAAVLTAPRRSTALAAILLGAAPLALAWFSYNCACFGSAFDAGFLHHADANYGPAYARGLFGVQWPNPLAIIGLTILPSRGIFFFSPFLLLAPVGFARLMRDSQSRRIGLTAAGVCVTVFLFATTTVDWRGGWAVSARYLVPIIPFLLIGVAAALRAPASPLIVVVFFFGATFGLINSAISASTFPDFPDGLFNPIYQCGLRLVQTFHYNGVLWRSASTVVDVVPWSILILFVIVFLARATPIPFRTAMYPNRIMTGMERLILCLGLMVPFFVSSAPYIPPWQCADVLAKMGFTCDADGWRLRIHRDKIKYPEVAYDRIQLAWIYAASPCAELRNSESAIRFARQAIALTGDTNAEALDALAAALAESGQFADAAAAVDRALAVPESDASKIAARQARWKLYRSGQPFRFPMATR